MRAPRIPKTRRITFEYDGEPVRIEYSTKRAGASFEENRHLLDSNDPDDKGKAVENMIASCVVSWDLNDEDGNPLPLGSDSVEDLLPEFVVAVGQKIGADFRQMAESLAHRHR